MATNTTIEWADKTWSPIIGCDRVSPGCDSCYAISTARIRESNPNAKIADAFAGTTTRTADGIDWSGKVNLLHDRLDQPYRWKRPAKVFVNSMSDLFHDAVPDLFITQVFDVMEAKVNQRHTFQILTKRHARMRSFMQTRQRAKQAYAAKFDDCPTEAMRNSPAARDARARASRPPANIWLGVSVEDQKRADLRIPALMRTPAAVRFVSCEPLLAPVDLRRWLRPVPDCGHVTPEDGTCGHRDALTPECHRWADCPTRPRQDVWRGLDWVIAGGESGTRARPMHPAWARQLRDDCSVAGVPFFFKQWGEWTPLGPLYGDLEDTDDGHLEAVHLEVAEGKRVIQLESSGYIVEGHQPGDSHTWLMGRVGKKAAGRVLDGRTHDAFPRDDFHDSITSGLYEDLDAFSRRMDATHPTRSSS